MSGQSDIDETVRILAEGIIKKSTGLAWDDAQGQAKAVAITCAAALREIVNRAGAIRDSENEQALLLNVKELLEFIGVPV